MIYYFQLTLSHQEDIYTKVWFLLKMSRRNGGNGKLDLKLNLSPPVAQRRTHETPSRSTTTSVSPTSSCVSSETELRYSSSPEATSMMLVGCPRCLMYVMLAEDYPKCPKCKSTVLLDVLHDNTTKKTQKTWSRNEEGEKSFYNLALSIYLLLYYHY